MARDRNEELERLQQALLEDDTEPREDGIPLDTETDIGDTEFYRNHAGTFRAYNSDRTDVDLEDYSNQVYEKSGKGLGCLVRLLILLTLVLVGLVAFILLKWEGLL